jgi:hypothetical protein
VPFERSALGLWKRLTRAERVEAARHFWVEPAPELLPAAQGALVKVLHVRPQSVRALPDERKVQGLSALTDPGEPLAAGLLVALHLGGRRALLAAFLDAAGLPHRDGLMPEDALEGPVGEAAARAGYQAIAAAFPEHEVQAYLNTLWLQDHDRWLVLEAVAERER